MDLKTAEHLFYLVVGTPIVVAVIVFIYRIKRS